MTTQSAISAQSFGTGSNVGNAKFSISPLTLAATTTTYVVNIQITSGTGPLVTGGAKPELRVWYTTTMRTVTSGNAPTQLGTTARYVDLRVPTGSSTLNIRDSSLEPVTGSKFHCWVDAPTLSTAATLDVDLVELP